MPYGSEPKQLPLIIMPHGGPFTRNKPHSYLVYQGEGHGFEKPENASAFLEQVDQFLRTNNPAD